MAKEISLLFPGQGSQFTGMLTQDLISSYKDIIDEASDILEIDFISLSLGINKCRSTLFGIFFLSKESFKKLPTNPLPNGSREVLAPTPKSTSKTLISRILSTYQFFNFG